MAGVGGLADIISLRGAGFIAILSAVASAVAASLGAPKTKERAAIAANAYRALQDARVFLNIDLERLPDPEKRERLQSLIDRLQVINKEAEIPSLRAFKRAKRQLARGSQEYATDRSKRGS